MMKSIFLAGTIMLCTVSLTPSVAWSCTWADRHVDLLSLSNGATTFDISFVEGPVGECVWGRGDALVSQGKNFIALFMAAKLSGKGVSVCITPYPDCKVWVATLGN